MAIVVAWDGSGANHANIRFYVRRVDDGRFAPDFWARASQRRYSIQNP